MVSKGQCKETAHLCALMDRKCILSPFPTTQELFDTHGMNDGRWMRIAPGRIAAAGFPSRDIDQILDGKTQSIQRPEPVGAISKVATKALLWAMLIVEVFILAGSSMD